jgi:hypothetical protein
MDVGKSFVVYAKSADFDQPAKDSLDDTTMGAQPAAIICASIRDERLDALLA